MRKKDKYALSLINRGKKKEPPRQNTHHPSSRTILEERKCSGAFEDMVEGHA
jgi:hypothetical protein